MHRHVVHAERPAAMETLVKQKDRVLHAPDWSAVPASLYRGTGTVPNFIHTLCPFSFSDLQGFASLLHNHVPRCLCIDRRWWICLGIPAGLVGRDRLAGIFQCEPSRFLGIPLCIHAAKICGGSQRMVQRREHYRRAVHLDSVSLSGNVEA